MSKIKNFGVVFAILFLPIFLIAIDLPWGTYSKQTSINTPAPYLNETLFGILTYAFIFAMPLYVFFTTKHQKFWLRIGLAFFSGSLMLLWVLFCVLMYGCSYGICL